MNTGEKPYPSMQSMVAKYKAWLAAKRQMQVQDATYALLHASEGLKTLPARMIAHVCEGHVCEGVSACMIAHVCEGLHLA